jgi:hypothetical protein
VGQPSVLPTTTGLWFIGIRKRNRRISH